MEEVIQERLREKYKHLVINVYLIEWRRYQINIKLKTDTMEYCKEIIYIWDTNFTQDVNMNTISTKIDEFILRVFRKENLYE